MRVKKELQGSINLVNTLAEKAVPRILTQVCRDPGSSCYGSFDRNWWHYKIRDFPSIVLQQGGYAIRLAGKLDAFRDIQSGLHQLAAASCLFWNKRAMKRGAFEEYYPWEQGYPAMAFSTLAVLKLAAEGVVSPNKIEKGVSKASSQLIHRFESRAANQQIAGLAALAWIRLLYPKLVASEDFEDLSRRSLELQSAEGWFEEYGGPDLGYLSVTIDCLWDLFDVTRDDKYLRAASEALKFIAGFAWLPSCGAGMHNARNTDYVLPYGIVRFMKQSGQVAELAAEVFIRLFGGENNPHFLDAVDDRYYCHYIGHSLIRASLELRDLPNSFEEKSAWSESRPCEVLFKQSGHYLRYKKDENRYAVIISLKKGGVFTLWSSCGYACDFGWVVKKRRKEWCSHWWAKDWKTERKENVFRVTGHMAAHVEIVSTPLRHFLLRIASCSVGQRLISFLKEQLIFKEKRAKRFRFEREILLKEDQVLVTDRIFDLPRGADVIRAPRSSKRYVASADSFHIEDVAPTLNVRKKEDRRFLNGNFAATTTYFFDESGDEKVVNEGET